MFGYIGTIESELKVREAASYSSWYCGLCKCMKRCYGPFSTLFLQYDCAFLALLFSGELGEEVDAKRCHCLHRCHDPRRKYRLETPALHFSAAVNVLLAYVAVQNNRGQCVAAAYAQGCQKERGACAGGRYV